jgi:hypothetical protein
MISVREAAESIADEYFGRGRSASMKDADAIADGIKEGLKKLGCSDSIVDDFDGPRRKHISNLNDASEQLIEKYLHSVPSVGEIDTLKQSIVDVIKKNGFTGMIW